MAVCEKSPEQIIEELRSYKSGQDLLNIFLSETRPRGARVVNVRQEVFTTPGRLRGYNDSSCTVLHDVLLGNVMRDGKIEKPEIPLVMSVRGDQGENIVMTLMKGTLADISMHHAYLVIPDDPANHGIHRLSGINNACGGCDSHPQLILSARSNYLSTGRHSVASLTTYQFDFDPTKTAFNDRVIGIITKILTPVSQEEATS